MIKCPSPSKCTGSDSHRIGTFCKARGRVVTAADGSQSASKTASAPQHRVPDLKTPKHRSAPHSRLISLKEVQDCKKQVRSVFRKLSEKPGLTEDDKKMLRMRLGQDNKNRAHEQAQTALVEMQARYKAIGFDDTEEDRAAEAALREAEEQMVLSQSERGQYVHVKYQTIGATRNVYDLARNIIKNIDGDTEDMRDYTRKMLYNVGYIDEININSFLRSANQFLDHLDEAGETAKADQYSLAKIRFAQRTLENILEKPERLKEVGY